MYEDGVKLLIKQAPNFITLKVYLQLSTMQTFDMHIITTVKDLARELGVSYVSAWKAIKWLKRHRYIEQTTVNGTPAFILNPSVATKGKKNIKAKKKIFPAGYQALKSFDLSD